jgi:hypothetical protein
MIGAKLMPAAYIESDPNWSLNVSGAALIVEHLMNQIDLIEREAIK